MQDKNRKRSTQKKRKLSKAKLKARRIQRSMYLCTGALILGAALFLLMPFLKTSFNAPPLVDAVPAGPVNEYNQPMYTPVPTPVPTPIPTPSPEPEPESKVYTYQTAGRKIDPKKKMVALTYDDGPTVKTTGEILRVLAENKAVATFFVLGDRAMANPDVMKKIAAGGHQIGTHSYDHANLNQLKPDQVLRQIEDSVAAVENACGVRPTILRPPYGAANDEVKSLVGMPLINWSVDTRDWETRNAKKVYNEIKDGAADGAIILMHDLYGSTAEASQRAIPALIKAGYQLVTIDELFMYRGPQLEMGKLYYNASAASKNASSKKK